ncbi:MAG TPA: hypothetical protein VFI20_01110, partial [Terracidiphilus sp.]|nr:hypothetical protein [Terracidiphilus sp.]
ADNRDVYGNILLTYLPHPGTAFYLGYTTDFVNLDSNLCTRGPDGLCDSSFPILPRSGSSLINDQSTIYMKINHLFRF